MKTIAIVERMLSFRIWWIPFELSTQKRTAIDKDTHNEFAQVKRNSICLRWNWCDVMCVCVRFFSFFVTRSIGRSVVHSSAALHTNCTVYVCRYIGVEEYKGFNRLCDRFIAIQSHRFGCCGRCPTYVCFFFAVRQFWWEITNAVWHFECIRLEKAYNE